MSRLANWALTKYSGVVASTPSATAASRGPTRRRRSRYSAAPINQAPSADAMRAAKALTPNTLIATMSTQYISGGLWK